MPEPTNLAQCRGAGCGGEGRVRAVFPGINQPVSFRAIGEESAFRPHYHGEGRPILAAFLVYAASVGAMRTIEPATNRILPRARRQFLDVRSVDSIVGQRRKICQLSLLPLSDGRSPTRFPVPIRFAHSKCAMLTLAPKTRARTWVPG